METRRIFEEALRTIEKSEMIVLRNIHSFPVYGQDIIFPYLMIFICHAGSSRALYDMQEIRFQENEVAIILPNHIIHPIECSPDYTITVIMHSLAFEQEMTQRRMTHDRNKFHELPACLLTDEEMANYIELSEKISKYFNYNSGVFDKKDEILMGLLLARKRIIHKAANKLGAFKKIIEERYERTGNLKYSLIYVPEGNKPDYFSDSDIFDKSEQVGDDAVSDHLIDVYTEAVMKIDKYITVRKFVSGQKDRDAILADFAKGRLQVLTSMKCLDEGVDVPRSELAIFCASTGNPRQFIQRRGRVLRTHPDKYMAEIHDLVVAPEVSATSSSYKMEQSLLKGELMRVKNFSMLSENPSYSQMELKSVMEHYGLNMYNNDHIV